MVLRPVQLPFTIGADVCSIQRISRIASAVAPANKRVNPFARRFLTPREVSHLHARFRIDTRGNLDSIAGHLAGRWAAKEAIIKAVKPRKLQPLEIEVWQTRDGEVFGLVADPPAKVYEDADYLSGIHPQLEGVALSGKRDHLERALDLRGNATILSVSISHDSDYAFAVALAIPDSAG